MTKKIPDNQIAFYQSPDGAVNVEVLYASENIWLTQKKIAELFNTTKQNVSLHFKNIFKEGELQINSVVKDFLTTAEDNKDYKTKF
ncbi:cell filamentation protein Fic [Candidatus Parcubacteria bacterium]|nr:cell filamentation protein Fic [Candidatus Parcubacteria bacterium]